MPIPIPPGVEVKINGNEVTVKGPKGSLSWKLHPSVKASLQDGVLKVEQVSEEREHRAMHGLSRSLLANMVTGVSQGFVRTLTLVGVGYRAQQSGPGATLSLMFSHPVEMKPPPGITLEVEGNSRLHVRGIDKQAVGQFAAQIRAIRPPNVYTGKGVRYEGEEVRLKPGKSARRA